MADEVVRGAIEAYFGALSRQDAKAWVEAFAADGETHELPGAPDIGVAGGGQMDGKRRRPGRKRLTT